MENSTRGLIDVIHTHTHSYEWCVHEAYESGCLLVFVYTHTYRYTLYCVRSYSHKLDTTVREILSHKVCLHHYTRVIIFIRPART